MTKIEKFCNWFKNELDAMDFVWNILMLTGTGGFWIFAMFIYYCFTRRKEK